MPNPSTYVAVVVLAQARAQLLHVLLARVMQSVVEAVVLGHLGLVRAHLLGARLAEVLVILVVLSNTANELLWNCPCHPGLETAEGAEHG